MKANGFGSSSRNVGSGGQRVSFDVFNRTHKSDPYNFEFKKENYGDLTGYMERNLEEYQTFPEMKDTTKDQDDQKSNAIAAGVMRNGKSRQVILRQIAGLLAGAVMITAGYQASLKERSQPPTDPDLPAAAADSGATPDSADPSANPSQPSEQPPSEAPSENPTAPTQAPTGNPGDNGSSSSSSGNSGSGSSQNSAQQPSASTTSWRWNDDGSATLVVTDSDGNIIAEIPADVTSSTEAATCTKAGRITRTANAAWDGQNYSDVHYEDLSALGHSFGSGSEVTLSDGRSAMEYECNRCHEHFTIVNSIDEE